MVSEKTIYISEDLRKASVFYYDGTKVNGYYAIKSRNDDEYIWVDCTKEQLSIFVDALNQEVLCQTQKT